MGIVDTTEIVNNLEKRKEREKEVISKRNIAKASIRGDLNIKKDEGNDANKDDALGRALNSRGSMSPGDFKKNVIKRRDSQNFKDSHFKDGFGNGNGHAKDGDWDE